MNDSTYDKLVFMCNNKSLFTTGTGSFNQNSDYSITKSFHPSIHYNNLTKLSDIMNDFRLTNGLFRINDIENYGEDLPYFSLRA